jgi:delta-aminolevulinic acid dehydratase/porphobilinogen synthase
MAAAVELIDERAMVLESLTAFGRAGAGLVIGQFAEQVVTGCANPAVSRN